MLGIPRWRRDMQQDARMARIAGSHESCVVDDVMMGIPLNPLAQFGKHYCHIQRFCFFYFITKNKSFETKKL